MIWKSYTYINLDNSLCLILFYAFIRKYIFFPSEKKFIFYVSI